MTGWESAVYALVVFIALLGLVLVLFPRHKPRIRGPRAGTRT